MLDRIAASSGSDAQRDALKAMRLPAAHPPVAGRAHRRAPRQSRHAGRHRLLADAALPQRVPLRPPRHRMAARSSGSRSCRASCSRCARRRAAGSTRRSGTASGTNRRSAPSRARRARSLPPSSPARRTSSSTGRCATASRRSRERLRRAAAGRLRAHPRLPALPAIQRHHDRHGERRRLRCAEGDAPAAGAAHRAALLRRAGLYRRARREHRDASRRPRFRAGGGDRLLSRPARSPISRRATRITATATRRRGSSRERLGWPEGRLITTFQSRFGPEEWLQPYTDKTVERLARRGREADRRRQSRLRLRLPGDAGGDRRAESPRFSCTMAASASPTFPA